MADKFDSSSTDAQYWAKNFMEIWQNEPIDIMDEAMMTSWFANAIMAGYDEARKKYEMVNAHETLMRHVLDR
ncbi:hypothetical protein HWB76_gp011 [Streptomyces phage Blueeyedbeauty]|uniref:Uncharacterized protein n=1 Tax=Streptomyces phage Blueeyedbeauty TaxID=2250336 RepID=A0A345L1K7_9CAUD|nr:hypothetical protein HWB76_gp011 [Streptomyces phage Blueeyedbeauty]AXH49159.1 hypothetical protein SEA_BLUEEYEDBEAUTY_11 [Streptomyces phage Blueeyedbeauty]